MSGNPEDPHYLTPENPDEPGEEGEDFPEHVKRVLTRAGEAEILATRWPSSKTDAAVDHPEPVGVGCG